jgi:putative aldouronate transport system substrate-binding protein
LKMKLTKCISVFTAAVIFLTGCASTREAPNAAVSRQEAADVKGLVKYDTPVELTTVRATESNLKFAPGESMDKNAVYDAYEKDLGIKLKNNWVVDTNQYTSKIDLSIASGDMPDFFKVSQLQLKKLVDADLIMDLTDLMDKNVSDDAKKFFTEQRQMDSATFNGKIMAIPFTDSPTNYSSYLWVRQDWLDKLHLPAPKTMQDVLKIAEAFSKNNPGGAANTYGLAATKTLYGDAYGLTGFFNGYHAYPAHWLKDASGQLVYGSIQPEMKTALKQLQDMYKAGLIDPEFGVKDPDKENELVSSNQLGMAYGLFWLASYPLKSAAVKDNKLVQDWSVYPIVSVDDKPAMTQVGLGVNSYYVISKQCKNPQAVFKILNKFAQPEKLKDKVYMNGVPGSDYYWKLNPIILYRPDLNVKSGEVLPEALKTKDVSKLEPLTDALKLYEESRKYLKGEGQYWNSWMKSRSGGSLEMMSQYAKQNRYLPSEFYVTPTPEMADKQSTLDAKEQEVFTKIITNQASIDDFDKFVADWKNLGGDTITKEVNEWYASKDKANSGGK